MKASPLNAHPILIVGGGLAGLTAARLLHRLGIDFVLLEARDRLGGRILSTESGGDVCDDGFDLGPSWFWPGMHSAITPLVDELGLPFFPQYTNGDMIFQRESFRQRFPAIRHEPQSMRFAGGTGALVSALAAALPMAGIRLGTRVTGVALDGQGVAVHSIQADGSARTMTAAHVLFALPPRLLEATIAFSPALDAATAQNWRDTPTWMAPHAKFVALYDRPFWRDAGLSGTAQSMAGPLVEIHDATTASGKAALFGFVGVPARQRAELGQDAIVAAAIQQLTQLFGPQAGAPRATLFKDWAGDPLTATADDAQAGGHPLPGGLAPAPAQWHGRILLAGSEAGRREPGYLAGAVEAAEYAVIEIVNRLENSRKPSS